MTPHRLTISLAGNLLFAAFCGLVLLSGCGKKGMPAPNDPARNFTWEQIDASPSGACLAFTGKFAGAYKNLDDLRLELAPVNGPEDCPGCPFVPREILYFSRNEAGFEQDTGGIGFSYCPQPAAAYRWRLTGISIFNRLPHTTSPVRFTAMPNAGPQPGTEETFKNTAHGIGSGGPGDTGAVLPAGKRQSQVQR